MRKTFLYPIIDNIKKGHVNWLIEQSKKGIVTKYLNKILPKKIIVGPTMAVLEITYRCNSHCIMCDLPKRALSIKEKEFTTEQWESVIDQLAEIKTAGLGFTGGEPLLRPDCMELMKYAKNKGMSVTLNTNAGLLTKEKTDQILDITIDNINISLDGVGKTYDEIRGISYKNVIENTKKFIKERNRKKSRTRVTIITCVSHYNINEIEKIAQSAINIGADKIGFIPLHHIPNTKEFTNVSTLNKIEEDNLTNMTNTPLSCRDNFPKIGKVFLEKICQIKRGRVIEVDNSMSYLNMFPIAFKGKNFPIPCLAGRTSITIDCYGNIYGCLPFFYLKRPSLKLEVPNLTNVSNKTNHTKTLKNLWLGKEYEEIRNFTDSCRACFLNCQSELSIFYK